MQPLEKNPSNRNTLDRILIIDDDPVFLHMYRNLFTSSSESYELVECTDGYAALGRMLERTPRLVLLDLSMPRFDGAGFLAIVKSKPELRSLPVFVISSDAKETHARIGNLENVRWLSKPVQLRALQKMLEIELGKRPAGCTQAPSSGLESGSNVFAPAHLDTYIGRDRVAQIAIAHKFCALSAERLAILEGIIQKPDRLSLRSLAHVLEGSAATLGALDLRATCRRLRDSLGDDCEDGRVKSEAAMLSVALQRFTVTLARHFNLNHF